MTWNPKAKHAGIGAAEYEAALGAYREHPGDHPFAAHASGLSHKVCVRLWDSGMSYKNLSPIREVLQEEQRLARALRAEKMADEKLAKADQVLHDADRQAVDLLRKAETDAKEKLRELHERSKVDAVQVMAEEAQLVTALRRSALSLHGMAGIIFNPTNMRAFASAYVKALGDKDLSPREAQQLLRALGSFTKDLAQLDIDVLDAERKRLGQPTEIVKVEVEHMEKEDALRLIEEAAAAAQLLRDEEDEPTPNGHANGSGNGLAH